MVFGYGAVLHGILVFPYKEDFSTPQGKSIVIFSKESNTFMLYI